MSCSPVRLLPQLIEVRGEVRGRRGWPATLEERIGIHLVNLGGRVARAAVWLRPSAVPLVVNVDRNRLEDDCEPVALLGLVDEGLG